MSAVSYKMTEMMPSTSAHLIDRSEDVIFQSITLLVHPIKMGFHIPITIKSNLNNRKLK